MTVHTATSREAAKAMSQCALIKPCPIQIAAWIHHGGLSQRKQGRLYLDDQGGVALVSAQQIVYPYLEKPKSFDLFAHYLNPKYARIIIGPRWRISALWARLQPLGFQSISITEQISYRVERRQFNPPKTMMYPLLVATPNDLEDLVQMSCAMAVEEQMPGVITKEAFRQRIQQRLCLRQDFVFRVNRKPVFKVCVPHISPLGGYIEGVYTVPSYRGQGIGLHCVAWITAWILKQSLMANLLVDVNNVKAQRIYESLGFRADHYSRTILVR